jgi:hypothetical protein
MPNSEDDTQLYNFQIDFYADTTKRHLIRRFEATPGSDDLQYIEVDNSPAVDQWTDSGLPILQGDSAFIQIYPVLDPTAGFLCGVTYAVQVNECHSIGEQCSSFTKINPSNWLTSDIGNNETIDDQIEANEEVMLGLSMKSINSKLCIAWRDSEGSLNFAQLNEGVWISEVVIPGGSSKVVYCDLSEINGLPSIAFVSLEGGNSTEGVLTLENGSWNTWPNMTSFQSGVLANPRSLAELNNAVVY